MQRIKRNGMSVMLSLLSGAVIGSVGMGLGTGGTRTVWAQDKSPSAGSTTPAALQGRWMYSTVSATNYSNANTGQYLGNGNSTGSLYIFDNKGNIHRTLMMNTRMYSTETKILNEFEGKVTFTEDTFTLKFTSGTFRTETNGRVTSHAASKEELAQQSKTYRWHTEKGSDGKSRFVLDFPDGSKLDYKRF